jgi:hypothetical protein
MPYPAAKEHPESAPWVTKLRGTKVGVSEAAKNSVPMKKPTVERECQKLTSQPCLMLLSLSMTAAHD